MNLNGKYLPWLLPLAAVSTLAGCGSDDSDTPLLRPPAEITGPDILVMHNGSDNAGQIDRLGPDLTVQSTFNADANEGMALDALGNLYLANDSGGAPSRLQVLHKLAQREDNGNAVATLDRESPAPQSMALKGLALAHDAGLVLAANVGGNSIEVFGTTAGDNAEPLASTTLANDVWDLAYDETADRLFLAVTNGTVLVVDDYISGEFSAAEAREITPDTAGEVSNIHGIAYQADTDTLVITDVGDAQVDDDGRLYVIAGAASAEGTVTPARTLAGDATRLGNPVNLVLDDGDAYIAEKANDAILVYRDVAEGESGNVAPSEEVESIKPESLAVVLPPLEQPDLSDIDAPGTDFSGVAVTQNQDGVAGEPDVLVLDLDLDVEQRQFSSEQNRESLTFNRLGDAYLTHDDGLALVNRLANGRDEETFASARDRLIQGNKTRLGAPKGLDLAGQLGWVLVADNGNPAVRVFGAQAAGNVPPFFSTPLSEAPWGLDYDPQGDRLFVALTDGTVAVFDDYQRRRGGAGPDRIIVPAEGGEPFAAPTNLHGIIHLSKTDQLIVTDVGSGTNAADGKIYVLDNAATADGPTAVTVKIDNGDNQSPGNTELGNPVDIAFDGEHLYVAEKARGRVLRFDAILDSPGGDVGPEKRFELASPESVSLIRNNGETAP